MTDSPLMRQSDSLLRRQYDEMVAENARLRDVLREVEAHRDRLNRAVFAVRRRISSHNPCHDGLREALLDALGDE